LKISGYVGPTAAVNVSSILTIAGSKKKYSYNLNPVTINDSRMLTP
jgi:hypothetical protein